MKQAGNKSKNRNQKKGRKRIKGYFSFLIVILLLNIVVYSILLSSFSFSHYKTIASNKLFYNTLDLSKSIEESAKTGALVGILIYLKKALEKSIATETSLTQIIDLSNLNKAGELGAFEFVELLEEEKLGEEYAIFCSSPNSFSAIDLERSMVRDLTLEIPTRSKHFSYENCINSIEVEVGFSLEALTNSPLSYEGIATSIDFVTISISKNSEYGLIGISYLDKANGIASAEVLKPRTFELDLLKDMEKAIFVLSSTDPFIRNKLDSLENEISSLV